MATMADFGPASTQSLPEALARTLRHEVGDLLQTIYAAVAILQRRLPSEATVERRVLVDLRSRAEGCKRLLDHLGDLVGPLHLSFEQVDLAQLAGSLVALAAPRYPELKILAPPSPPVLVPVDEKRIAQVGEILLTQACEAAQRHVCFRIVGIVANGEAEWTVTDDRPVVSAEQREEVFRPAELICDGKRGIELTLAQRLVRLHGGRIAAEITPEGSFCVRVLLPSKVQAADG